MTPPKEIIHFMKCLAGLRNGDELFKSGNHDLAEEWYRKTLELAGSAPPEVARDLVPYALCILSATHQQRGRITESRELRERAIILLDSNTDHLQSAFFHKSMAQALTRLKDYRRAIGFWEYALQLADDEEDPQGVAKMLHELGVCYCRLGLRDHATIPLRAALNILQSCPEHPMRPLILLTLGNALRKSEPSKAEACFRETAESYASRLKYESATPAWGNLAILLSELGRHGEALELQEKVLHIRENAAGESPSNIARVHNNIACIYRRMGEIDKALKSVDRAIEMFPVEEGEQACAYSTRAMILRDAGKDAEAIEWFKKALLTRGEQASPALDSTADDLEGAIALLVKQDRRDEAIEAQAKLAEIHRAMQETPQSTMDMNAVKGFVGGTVIIELGFGGRERKRSGNQVLRSVVAKLSDAVNSQGVGELTGDIMIPESTTLIFSGPDAERLSEVLEPLLMSEQISAGARIVVRQGDTHRETSIPHSPLGLN